MTDETVIPFTGITYLDLDPDRVIEGAKGQFGGGVVIIGYDAEGRFGFSSSLSDGATVLWLLRKTERRLFEVADKLEKGEQ